MKTARNSREPEELRANSSTAATVLAIIGIIFIAVNLRSPLTSVGPLMELLRVQLKISSSIIGLIPAIPLIAFGIFSNLSPILAQKAGLERVLFFSLLLLTAGIILRSTAGETMLFLGTVLIGLAISVCNVLLPSLIKRDFRSRTGVMTGIFSVSMNLCGAIASGISIPLASRMDMGWSGALGIWAVLSFVSLILWFPQVRKRRTKSITQSKSMAGGHQPLNLWKSSTAWSVTFFMGFQSLLFYAAVAWIPEILMSQGMKGESAGWMVSYMQFAILPVTFIVPIIAGRMANQRLLVGLTAIMYAAGIAGILFGGYFIAIMSMILYGIAVGSSFSLAMMFFSLRTQTAHHSAQLSGMAQSVGYLLAAAGPMLFGLLHTISKGWTVPLLLLMICAVLLFISGLRAGSNRFIEQEAKESNEQARFIS